MLSDDVSDDTELLFSSYIQYGVLELSVSMVGVVHNYTEKTSVASHTQRGTSNPIEL